MSRTHLGNEETIDLNFRTDPKFRSPAKAAITAAVEERDRGFASNQIADRKLRARRERVREAWRNGFDLVELAIAEYLTREDQRQVAMPITSALEDLKAAIMAVGRLHGATGRMESSLLASEVNQIGSEVCEALTIANGHILDATQALLVAQEAIQKAQRDMPKDTSGAGGAIGRLRSYSPDVALLFKLQDIWSIAGLTSRSGQSGDGLDVFLRHALEEADRQKADHEKRAGGSLKKRVQTVSKGDWLDKLKEKARRERDRLPTDATPQ